MPGALFQFCNRDGVWRIDYMSDRIEDISGVTAAEMMREHKYIHFPHPPPRLGKLPRLRLRSRRKPLPVALRRAVSQARRRDSLVAGRLDAHLQRERRNSILWRIVRHYRSQSCRNRHPQQPAAATRSPETRPRRQLGTRRSHGNRHLVGRTLPHLRTRTGRQARPT